MEEINGTSKRRGEKKAGGRERKERGRDRVGRRRGEVGRELRPFEDIAS